MFARLAEFYAWHAQEVRGKFVCGMLGKLQIFVHSMFQVFSGIDVEK